MTDVVVVGGGPAGLACAIELRRRGVAEVVVLDREPAAGGIPRHCAHQGFGVRDLRRVMTGPRYARRYVELAWRAGVSVCSETMVTGWLEDGALEVTSPRGRETVRATAVVLATGCRERPRSARLVPGSRPDGVLTTGMLQQLVELPGRLVGTRALIVGAEHVSYSALLTLAHSGVRVAGMTTDLPRQQSFALAHVGAAIRYLVPLWTRTIVASIHGRTRVEGVELLNLDSGRLNRVACDTLVFTGDWIPDHELAASAGLDLDAGTRGPRVDTGLRTGREGVFAAGNVLQGAEPADVAALSGRHAAEAVARWVTTADGWPAPQVPISCEPPLQWISPNAISEIRDEPPRGLFALRSKAFLHRPTIEIRQDGRLLWRGRLRRLVPGRSAGIPTAWLPAVDLAQGTVAIGVAPR